jgi:hypothetical protein
VNRVGPRESKAASHRVDQPPALEHGGRHGEPEESEPHDGRQDDHAVEERHRQEDQVADHESDRDRAARRPRAGGDQDAAHVGRRHQERSSREDEGQVPPAGNEGDADGRGRRPEAEGERRPEAATVELQRFRDELPDGPRLRRQRRRQRLLLPGALPGHGGTVPPEEARQAAAGSASAAFSNTSSPSLASTRTVSPSANSPSSRRRASGFSSRRWIARLSGRAP